jgi:hypothetical protein
LAQKKSGPIGRRRDYDPMALLPRPNTGPFLPYSFVLLQASIWGHCPPQPVPLFRHAPSLSLLLPIGPDFFEPNLYLKKYPSNIVPVILLVHMTYEDGTDRVFQNDGTIKFRHQGITQEKEYRY